MDRKRSSEVQTKYSHFLATKPLCRECSRETRTREREEHHRSIRQSNSLPLSLSLLQRIQFPRSDNVHTCIHHEVTILRVVGKRIDSLTVDFRRSVLFRESMVESHGTKTDRTSHESRDIIRGKTVPRSEHAETGGGRRKKRGKRLEIFSSFRRIEITDRGVNVKSPSLKLAEGRCPLELTRPIRGEICLCCRGE